MWEWWAGACSAANVSLGCPDIERQSNDQLRTDLLHKQLRGLSAASGQPSPPAGARTIHPSLYPQRLREDTTQEGSTPPEASNLAFDDRPNHRFGSFNVGRGQVRPHGSKPRQHRCGFAVQPGDDHRLAVHDLADERR